MHLAFCTQCDHLKTTISWRNTLERNRRGGGLTVVVNCRSATLPLSLTLASALHLQRPLPANLVAHHPLEAPLTTPLPSPQVRLPSGYPQPGNVTSRSSIPGETIITDAVLTVG